MFSNKIKSTSTILSLIVRRSISQSPNFKQHGSYEPNGLEKRFLVWTGKYKSLAEVPNLVTPEVMERSRNKMRIRIANMMIVVTIIGCGVMVYTGKEAAKRGESVTKQNLEWHKKYNEMNPNQEK